MQLFIRTGLAAYHSINREYIASILCENKSKPNSRCNGACQLKRSLKSIEERERKASGSIREILELLVFANEAISFPGLNKPMGLAIYGSPYTGRLISLHGDGVFHPPPVIV